MKNRAVIQTSIITLKLWLKSHLAIFLILTGLSNFMPAHTQISFTINISSQPLWGPVNYDYVEYYYLPEPDVFYYVPTSEFIYWNGSNWMFVSTLPQAYRIDLFNTYKVVINQPKPYLHHRTYVTRYGKYKTVHGRQVVIRDSPNKKYYIVKGHSGPPAKAVRSKNAKGRGKKH